MNKTSIYSTLLVLAISLSAVGFAYSGWTDQILIQGRVKMAHVSLTITSQKVITSQSVEEYSTISEGEITNDGNTLELTATNLKPCWFVWIGIVCQNQGSIPIWVKSPEITFSDPNDLGEHFEYEAYYYGPYPESTGFGNLELWGSIKVGEELLSDGTVDFNTPENPPPFKAQPMEKVVIWIWLHVKDTMPQDAQGEQITIYVNIMDDMAV